MKREGSLGEACAVSLSPLFMADPPPHSCTQAPYSQSPLGALCLSWSLGLEEEHPPGQPKSDDTGIPEYPTVPVGIQGLTETIGWEPSGQAGRSMENVRPASLRVRLPGKKVRHLEPR